MFARWFSVAGLAITGRGVVTAVKAVESAQCTIICTALRAIGPSHLIVHITFSL